MIGIFDSGVGGLTVMTELRKLLPQADICYFADKKNAPYGTKTRRELIRLVKRDILRLKAAGADRILIACCTAGTVYEALPESMQTSAVPLIRPTACEAAAATVNGKICVIATEATVRSKVFSSLLYKQSSVREVLEIPAQELVTMIESGMRDGKVTEHERVRLISLLAPVKRFGADVLILGCTHFPHIEKEISDILGGVKIISSSRAGAAEMAKLAEDYGSGKTVFL